MGFPLLTLLTLRFVLRLQLPSAQPLFAASFQAMRYRKGVVHEKDNFRPCFFGVSCSSTSLLWSIPISRIEIDFANYSFAFYFFCGRCVLEAINQRSRGMTSLRFGFQFSLEKLRWKKGTSTWGHPQTGSHLAQFEAVFFGTFFASSANRC